LIGCSSKVLTDTVSHTSRSQFLETGWNPLEETVSERVLADHCRTKELLQDLASEDEELAVAAYEKLKSDKRAALAGLIDGLNDMREVRTYKLFSIMVRLPRKEVCIGTIPAVSADYDGCDWIVLPPLSDKWGVKIRVADVCAKVLGKISGNSYPFNSNAPPLVLEMMRRNWTDWFNGSIKDRVIPDPWSSPRIIKRGGESW
jgi:hypothetical protein